MGRVWAIYTNDLRGIFRNVAAAVIISGLAFLPSLYAWFNIKASWDPYSQTGSLAIAVVNKDEGAVLREMPIRAGDEIMASLKENKKIGWVFVDEKKAMEGVKHGDYYASITIPSDFSAKMATVLSDNLQQAELDYAVNEKINAVSPKIAQKGASGIIEEVRASFVKTANETIFRIFARIGVELEENKPAIEQVRNTVFKLESLIPTINDAIALAAKDIEKSKKIAGTVQAELPKAAKLAKDGEAFTKQLGLFFEQSTLTLDTAGPLIKQDLGLLLEAAHAMEELTVILQDSSMDSAVIRTTLELAGKRLTSAVTVTDGMIKLLGRLNHLSHSEQLSSAIGSLQQINNRFQQQLTLVQQIRSAIDKGEEPAQTLMDRLSTLSKGTAGLLSDLLSRYDSELWPRIKQAADKAKQAASTAQSVLKEAGAAFPDVVAIVNDTAKGLELGGQELAKVQANLPAAEKKIMEFAKQIRELEQEGNLDELIDLLQNDAEREGAFFAEPVVLKENRLFPIPNYGSAMSPFFTTLSLWVGALLLVSLLTVDVHHAEHAYRSYEVYLGRYLTFLTIAIVQSLLVTLGDIWLLKAYVADPVWFVLFGILLSSVFMLIVYTLVSIFGNVGKAMAIVLLVLQLAGSGGTFPIQVTPPFFQAIHPFLPFTYAISMMREAVGGILWDIVARDLLALAIFAGVALLLGLALKKWINQYSTKMMEKAKESGLIH
ncbi:YhgE/Pip domain-containing protein [Paenibacillus paeoniae]|uniref:YhgE/Pip domain-containing protein n=1 Tax=Paenibacillus paeoniae TaxID=2292705 RepID=A0A371PKU2_9BACL|nr:YhgE/Pip domain-containing protein [Paenibacillus paeoniae]REK76816.1 YhgE/Pip domain-containing protein [Paenibacillus paeoniae]